MLHTIVGILGWLGVPVVMIAGTLIQEPKTRLYGFYAFIVAEFLLCGVQLEAHAWNQVVLFAYLCAMNFVGAHKDRKARRS